MQQEAFPDEDISDRPLPEESVPGLLELLTDDLPSGRYRAQDFTTTQGPDDEGVHELRVALMVEDLDEAAALYRDALGLPVVEQWSRPESRGLILDAGPASIELLDRAEAARVDRIEVGEQVSGPVRLAFGVSNVETSASSLRNGGAKALGEPVHTPWGDLNQRLRSPDGLQLTLFQSAAERPTEKEVI
jgi:catechol 2,3-dioxygenase-like lactoylglutathione lyase family enzyme